MEQKIRTELADRLDSVKRHFGLNNSQLSKLAEVTPQAINDIMNGVTDNPRVSLINKIATKLGLSVDWLLNGKGEMLLSEDSNTKAIQGDAAMFDFMKRQIEEKDKMISWLRDRLGKRKGVSNQASLFPVA
jgi:transcriptional regulator with XRE-family HTH domain